MIWRKSAASSDGETSSAKRVLVIQLGGLGAFVLALAAAKRIREAHVGARITLLTTEATKDLAEKAPYFDTVEADGKPTEPQAITKLIARIRAAKYDVVYDLEGSNRTSNYFQGLRPWPPKWSGPTPGASYAYLDGARAQMHPLDRYAATVITAAVAQAVGADGPATALRFAPEPPPRRVAMQRLAEVAGLAALAPSHLAIHPIYGPWFGLRAAIVVDVDGPPPRPPVTRACDCAHGCAPALDQALAAGPPRDGAELRERWRLWLAVRDACPVGRAHRYGEEQLTYHYTGDRSLLG